MLLAGVALVLFLIFSLVFYINIWIGSFFFIWTIVSITWFCANIGNKYRNGEWYDWIIGLPVLGIICVFASLDRTIKEKYKKNNS